MKPREVPGQVCLSSEVVIEPRPDFLVERTDYFGNPFTVFTVEKPHKRMVIESLSVVEVNRPEPVLTQRGPTWEQVRDQDLSAFGPMVFDAFQFSFDSNLAPGVPAFKAYAQPSFPPGQNLLTGARDLTARIFHEFKFDPTTTTVATPVIEVLEHRSGVCQDFAHVMIACLRALGLPARYVSGYLRTEPPPGKPRLIGADASHAWVGVFSPGVGWIDFDPTNDRVVGSDHITVAWGRDYSDVAPVRGLILGGGEHWVDVEVDVEGASDGIPG
jgi:transglutaminase-like putative cysteine protease